MKNFKIVWDEPELYRTLKTRTGVVGRDLEARASKVMWAAKAQAGMGTGRLKLSIHMKHNITSTGQSFKVGSPLHYALMHHEGTRPHIIIAAANKVLRFVKRGSVIYVNSPVRHPGTRPNRYLTDNLPLVLTPTAAAITP